MKIAIKFGDNDFGNTFKGVLQMLLNAHEYNGLTPDKDKLLFLINKLSPIAYVSHQNQWEYNGLEEAKGKNTEENEEFIRISNYLQITKKQLLVDKEVDEYLKKLGEEQWDNSETFILDTELYNNKIYFV